MIDHHVAWTHNGVPGRNAPPITRHKTAASFPLRRTRSNAANNSFFVNFCYLGCFVFFCCLLFFCICFWFFFFFCFVFFVCLVFLELFCVLAPPPPHLPPPCRPPVYSSRYVEPLPPPLALSPPPSSPPPIQTPPTGSLLPSIGYKRYGANPDVVGDPSHTPALSAPASKTPPPLYSPRVRRRVRVFAVHRAKNIRSRLTSSPPSLSVHRAPPVYPLAGHVRCIPKSTSDSPFA